MSLLGCQCTQCDAPIKRSQSDWDLFFMSQAEQVGRLSKDPDRKVGAIIITADRRQMSFGYNGFPPDVEDRPSLLADRDFKLDNMVHAEMNAIGQCPFPMRGTTLYVTRFPCLPCAKEVAARRIGRIVAPEPDFRHSRWGVSWAQAIHYLADSNVHVETR